MRSKSAEGVIRQKLAALAALPRAPTGTGRLTPGPVALTAAGPRVRPPGPARRTSTRESAAATTGRVSNSARGTVRRTATEEYRADLLPG